jgi:chaperone modulatory protein CbpM
MGQIVGYAIDAVIVEDCTAFSLADFSRACGLESADVIALVDEGILEPAGSSPEDWTFRGPCLRTARAAQRLRRDLEMDLSSVAVVLDLLAEIDALRAQLNRTLAR